MENDKKYWFVAKRYGWGWTPATWQGWLVLLAYVILIFGFAATIDESSAPREVIFIFALPIFLLTVTLIRICYAKGEKPSWRWASSRVAPSKERSGSDKK